ncbi:hypothetical protein MZK47_04190 [Microbacterium aerolatum]|uniref:hypothetical protein n=1 Tax=Microbacterium aerolatum TaxID=153731 RepID=UPI002001C0C9|nr:hypothetical protein [Microbacterium aerolatum]MCK3768868.1 hypothetical protein [Microbacterium aerolatum]
MADARKARRRLIRPIDLVDVLVYLIVLELFVQFFPSVVSESFLVSVITAVLMKIALEIVVTAKTAILRRLRAGESRRVRETARIALVILSAGSKFLVLWLTDLVLGGAVRLGGFIEVTLLIVALMAARYAVRALIR